MELSLNLNGCFVLKKMIKQKKRPVPKRLILFSFNFINLREKKFASLLPFFFQLLIKVRADYYSFGTKKTKML